MPRKYKDIVALSRSHTDAAVKTLVGIMNQPKAPAAARVSAANAILDRGWGKPSQAVVHTGKDGGPIETKDQSNTEVARKLIYLLGLAAQK